MNSILTNYPPEGYHLEAGRCPNVRDDGKPVACNCIGACQPTLVKDTDD